MPLEYVEILVNSAGIPAGLVLNRKMYRTGDQIGGVFGLMDDCVLDERLFNILSILAVRRKSSEQSCWVTASELAVLVDNRIESGGVAKFLYRRFMRKYNDEELTAIQSHRPSGFLIEYYPPYCTSNNGIRGSSVKGPYRVGVPASSLHINVKNLWRYLLGCSTSFQSGKYIQTENESTLEDVAFSLIQRGSYIEARYLMIVTLRDIYLGRRSIRSSRSGLINIASYWLQLGRAQMELGLPAATVYSLQKAIDLCEEIHPMHPPIIAQALDCMGHAYAQMGRVDKAIACMNRTSRYIENLSNTHEAFSRAQKNASLGQFLIKAAEISKGRSNIERAIDVALEEIQLGWANTWRCRLVTADLSQGGRLSRAETLIQTIDNEQGVLTAAQQALIFRTKAEVFVAMEYWDEAAVFAAEALALGMSNRMRGLIKNLRPTINMLHKRGAWKSPDSTEL